MGGHSVTDQEMKYGLSVTGIVHPEKLITNSGSRIGDVLVLTKSLGTGVMSTALKNRRVNDEHFKPVLQSMTTLNKKAAELMIELNAHACTDITGFGLVGHASHLVQEGETGIELIFENIPSFPGVMDFLKEEVVPGGLVRNRDYYSRQVDFKNRIPEYKCNLLFDPQTSGGLLIVLPSSEADELLKKLRESHNTDAAIIGRIIKQSDQKIIVR
jgi:selenide,water dikinase